MSYYTVLNIQKEPFSTSPDPTFFYHSPEHTTVLRRLEISIRLRRGLCLVLGDVGTGKTTLSRALLQSFSGEEDNFIFHMVLDPDFKSEYQFLSSLTKIFGVSPFFRSAMDHREAIEKYLFQKGVEEKKTVVLLVDEGQKLSQPLLEVLRTLLNYETNEYKLLQLIIMSQMELLPRVKKIRNFMDRVSLKYMINPLDEKETKEMIDFRLRQAGFGGDRSLFSQEAVQRIYEFSQGYPRKIALICHNCLERLVMENREMVSGDLVSSLIQEEGKWS
ncbi:MAG TPA: AAA family ATPase [Candidatus Omnitrophota bacterium]|nr:AAA family ATPase [Candidatus Omnitrophota bacterium]HPD84698.1 AAA family ATPase [Candidatus Omnitrophota bacterium]HRZ03556.1 AAA family ATPase [Candidatus Omnitrophota bacterium]